MTHFSIRQTLARFVLIFTLGVTIATGTLVVSGASDAAAMPRDTCARLVKMAQINYAHAQAFIAIGDYQSAQFYMGKVAALTDTYDQFC